MRHVGQSLQGHHALLLEDQGLIALDVIDLLEREGARVLHAGSVAEALPLAASEHITFGVVDMALADGDAEPVCQALDHRRIPYVFLTGFDRQQIGRPLVPLIAKPALPNQLLGAIQFAIEAGGDNTLEIVPAERRIHSVAELIRSLRAKGYDCSIATELLRTMAESLDATKQDRDRRNAGAWIAPEAR